MKRNEGIETAIEGERKLLKECDSVSEGVREETVKKGKCYEKKQEKRKKIAGGMKEKG